MTGEELALARLAWLEGAQAFHDALLEAKAAAGSQDDRNVAMWVASALHGIAKGFADVGHAEASASVYGAGAAIVRALASGEWRKDLST